MMKSLNHNQRTYNWLREQGWVVAKSEYYNFYSRRRTDLFGLFDCVCLGEGSIIGVQSCGSSFAKHNKKIIEDEEVAPIAYKWLKNGGRLILIGWRKILKKRGGKLKIWAPRIKEYKIGDFGGSY